MSMRGSLWKPWFVYRPTQLLRRVNPARNRFPSGYRALETAWGFAIHADPTRAIGHSILTTGVFDLAVSEVLARLIAPGATVVDAGANVGYMTILAAVAAGPRGRVLAFEPHPAVFSMLQLTVADARARGGIAVIDTANQALGDREGTAQLEVPSGFDGNDGTARIAAEPLDAGTVAVPMRTVDSVLGDGQADLLKLDVEGFESEVLAGAARALEGRRIRHVVFEDHDVSRSAAVQRLHEAGMSSTPLVGRCADCACSRSRQGRWRTCSKPPASSPRLRQTSC